MRTCKVRGCDKTHKGTTKGMCWMHYYRERRHGSPETVKINPEGASNLERLYSIGWAVRDSGCWEFSGARHSSNYGQLSVGGKTTYAHRLMYEIHNGDYLLSDHIQGDVIMHTCDNPPCVNPSHLRKGTHQDNMDDMVNKNRARKKEPTGVSQ